MDKRKILRNRSLKLLTLLLTSMLIATASAAVYNYMYVQSEDISAKVAKVTFASAADSTAAGFSAGTNGTYASFNSMAGWPNATRTYQATCGIQNSHTAAVEIELKFDLAGDWSGDTGQIDSITVILRNTAGGTQQGTTITVGSAGSTTGAINIPASNCNITPIPPRELVAVAIASSIFVINPPVTPSVRLRNLNEINAIGIRQHIPAHPDLITRPHPKFIP